MMSAHSYISQFFSFNDRNIVAISYNILNLPDTIQFGNGNQIVNLYDAAGRKYKSIAYTNISTTMPSVYQVVHYTLNSSSVDYHVTEYAGSVENHYMRTDTTQRIHNAIGYYTDGTYYHYLKDHLGNICSVVNSNTDAVVQKIQYYASGVPMQSNTLGVQPYLYNGKEFVTAHELDSYDYGFRNYYATIGRFSTMDPLSEQTPWHSPYSYAGNRFVNAIDWMGLMSTYHYTEINNEGEVVVHIDNDDNSVLLNGEKIGTEVDGEDYIVGWRSYVKLDRVGIRMIYNYSLAIWITRNTPFDERIGAWMRAKHVDSYAEKFSDNVQPIAQNIVLLIPILSQYNDVLILLKSENIYGQKSDEIDKGLAVISLLTFGSGKLIPKNEVKAIMNNLGWGANILSFFRSLQQNNESTSETTD